jgi:holo-[acyl-carrier protein] synthase
LTDPAAQPGQSLRIGVDLIDVARVEKTLAKYGERFLVRCFTPGERHYCADRPERLAARLAVKEAVGKALGTGIGDVAWLDIEIAGDERGRPVLQLHGAAARLAKSLGLCNWEISLSHTATQAIAFVVALG